MKVFLRRVVAACLVLGLLVGPALAQPNEKKTDEVKPHDPADLEIGKVAPDIEAEDVFEVPFKLSDYRGKVVVLDFWGDW